MRIRVASPSKETGKVGTARGYTCEVIPPTQLQENPCKNPAPKMVVQIGLVSGPLIVSYRSRMDFAVRGTIGAVALLQVPQPTVRNPLTCRRCATRLVVECAQSTNDSVAARPFSFECPACRGWNADVRLPGNAIDRVFLDPRGSGRSERSIEGPPKS